MDSMMYFFSAPPQVRWKLIPAARVTSSKTIALFTADGVLFALVCVCSAKGTTRLAPSAVTAAIFLITGCAPKPCLRSPPGFSSVQRTAAIAGVLPLSGPFFRALAPVGSAGWDPLASVRLRVAARQSTPKNLPAQTALCPDHRMPPDFADQAELRALTLCLPETPLQFQADNAQADKPLPRSQDSAPALSRTPRLPRDYAQGWHTQIQDGNGPTRFADPAVTQS